MAIEKNIGNDQSKTEFNHLPIVERIESKFIITNPEKLDEIAEHIRNGELCVLAFNHQSLSDIVAVYLISDRLVKKVDNEDLLKGFCLPYMSILDNPEVKKSKIGEILSIIKERSQEKGTFLTPFSRGKDLYKKLTQKMAQIKEKFKGEKQTEELKRVIKKESTNAKNERKILLEISSKKGNSLAAFIEGTIQSGRINPDTGQIYGLQFIEDKSIIDEFLKNNSDKNIQIIGVVVNGGYKFVDPNDEDPKINFDSPIIEITIGTIFSYKDLIKNEGDFPLRIVWSDINSNLPPEAQYQSKPNRINLQ